MLFLLNEVVLNLDGVPLAPRIMGVRFKALTFNAVIQLGQELYAEHPLLHEARPDRARRLAALLLAKAPQVNAAIFVAPRFGCAPDEVAASYANVQFDIMAELWRRQKAGVLDAVTVDRYVWRRLAA